MYMRMQVAINSERLVISCVPPFSMRFVSVSLSTFQINLLFVVDELIDEQNGKDALITGNIFLNAMHGDTWDDHSIFSKMTKEFVLYSPEA
jgi:hypothetical protein